ncbi:DUF421 domain-containing protein [Flavobacteriaceae bacterium Ap0902]|nr:DUF421 domain-containing protein [Flavobacteriaceae bacterium Ap0902]
MNWILEDWNIILNASITAIVMLCVVMIVTRINGLRSFAKITPIDFAVTVTIGSVINSTIITDGNSIVKGSIVIFILLAVQTLFGKLKSKFNWFDKVAFNDPIFLMRDGEFLDENIRATNVSRANIVAKLRENNVNQLSQVRAVVLETTGDISVMSGDNKIDDYLISDVKESPSDKAIRLEKQ